MELDIKLDALYNKRTKALESKIENLKKRKIRVKKIKFLEMLTYSAYSDLNSLRSNGFLIFSAATEILLLCTHQSANKSIYKTAKASCTIFSSAVLICLVRSQAPSPPRLICTPSKVGITDKSKVKVFRFFLFYQERSIHISHISGQPPRYS